MISATHLHPMLVHFPIALLLAAFLSEIIAFIGKRKFFNQASLYLLLLGTAGAVATMLSGDFASESIESAALKAPVEAHEKAAELTFWLAVIASIVKTAIAYFKLSSRYLQWIMLALFLSISASLTNTAYLGGQLVYKHGAGVEQSVSKK